VIDRSDGDVIEPTCASADVVAAAAAHAASSSAKTALDAAVAAVVCKVAYSS
jgi:hypothetical protein